MLKIPAMLSSRPPAMALPAESAAQPRPQELAANSRVIIDYIDPRLPRSQITLDRLKKRQVLEELSMFLSPLRLPRPLRVRTKSCGVVNAFYVPTEWAINLCYEYYENLEAIAPADVSPQGYTRDEVIVGGFIDAIFHELGHALFDILSVPVFGREEDAADQLSAFLMLQFGKDVARITIKGAAYHLSDLEESAHAHRIRRRARRACAAVLQLHVPRLRRRAGGFREYVDRGVLPKARAEHCGREYLTVRRAFTKTIFPYIDVDLMKKVQSIQWLRQTDGRKPN